MLFSSATTEKLLFPIFLSFDSNLVIFNMLIHSWKCYDYGAQDRIKTDCVALELEMGSAHSVNKQHARRRCCWTLIKIQENTRNLCPSVDWAKIFLNKPKKTPTTNVLYKPMSG